MKTRPIPAVIMMLAGFITCLMAIFNRMDTMQFLQILLGVLIGFYILGCMIKLVLDKGFSIMEKAKDIEADPSVEEGQAIEKTELSEDEDGNKSEKK